MDTWTVFYYDLWLEHGQFLKKIVFFMLIASWFYFMSCFW